MEGVILKSNSGFYEVLLYKEQISVTAKMRGILRHQEIEPVVGDKVRLEDEVGTHIIVEVYPRKNELIRPKVANIDYALVVISVSEPKFQDFLLDKYLVVLELNKIEPLIIFTKLDLLTDEKNSEIREVAKYYENSGYHCFFYSKNHDFSLDKQRLLGLLEYKISCVVGQTGVGKSTLLNEISGNRFKLQTNEISKALGRGKHTTRIVELFSIGKSWIADTPGFSSFSVDMIKRQELSSLFIEFAGHPCKYNNCVHINETICGVKDAVSSGEILEKRYQNYCKIYAEIEKGGKKLW
ncbi:putative ribosome biogenesis GTPase RsgA [Erysipelotrichaceae bacterium]|nr:putative ribosome biogenesis GTPase RsgA [Erysipelotrichaceae bacterium]